MHRAFFLPLALTLLPAILLSCGGRESVPDGETVPDTAALAPGPPRVVVTGSVVNLRTGPGTGFTAIETVREGDTLVVLGEAGDWLKVYSRKLSCFAWIFSGLTSTIDQGAGGPPS